MARLHRVPYEWILGAMFVATFAVAPSDQVFVFRGLWLILIAPAAGLALGVKRKPWDSKPRAGVVLLAGVFGWLIMAAAIVVLSLAQHWSRDAREIAEGASFVLVLAAGAAGLLALLIGASRPGRYRELGIFLNAGLLLPFALMFDMMLTPRH